MALKVYSADEVTVTFAGILLEAENDDAFVSIEKTNETFTPRTGINGHMTRSRTNDGLYRVTVTLPQSSDKNILLSSLHNGDKLVNGAGVAPFTVTDTNGTTNFISPEAWIVTDPTVAFAAESDAYEWTFDCSAGKMIVGGN